MSSPIIIIRETVQPGATVVFHHQQGIHVVNPDGHIAAVGFPSYDFAYGWIHAMTHHKD